MSFTSNAFALPPFRDSEARAALYAAHRVLALDCPDSAVSILGNLKAPVFAQWRFLGAPLLKNVRPEAIVAPLISPEWDIVDLGTRLHRLRWTGDLFALTRPLPRTELVLRETRAVCPGLSVHLIALP